MRKGFTLVELLVVVVVLATLMAIVFRLSGIGGSLSARNVTIQRLQRLENCLSGYFAAYGSYPPVALRATHDVYQHADEYGMQEDKRDGDLVWDNVKAVCMAQPFASRFPFAPQYRDVVDKIALIMRTRANSSDSRYEKYRNNTRLQAGFGTITSPNEVSGWNSESAWSDVQIFQFGLMSYLLPRYLTMARSVEATDLQNCKQWTDSNEYACNPNTGMKFGSWEDQLKDVRLVKRIPSQSVCARWIPNLEGMVRCSTTDGRLNLYGVNVANTDYGSLSLDVDNANVEIFEGSGRQYVLDSMTVYDGWENEFYYYSPPPYQSYRLWSAGSNGKTFPPWIPLDSLKSTSDRSTAAGWMADDIIHQSN